MSEVTDVQRMLAEGVEITLKNGEQRRLVLEGRPLALLEERFDGLQQFMDSLRRRPLNTIAAIFEIAFGLNSDEVWRIGLDTRRLNEYTAAIGVAVEEALPEVPVMVSIVQTHEVAGERYKAGTTVSVTPARARHLLEARVAKVPEADEGNGERRQGSESPGAASSMSRSPAGASIPTASGA